MKFQNFKGKEVTNKNSMGQRNKWRELVHIKKGDSEWVKFLKITPGCQKNGGFLKIMREAQKSIHLQ